jgi:hypothetical protein
MYQTWEEVRMENKFAPVPLTIPLHDDPIAALGKVKKVTATLRTAFGKIYATYWLARVLGGLLPGFVVRAVAEMGSLPATLAFSNVPGVIKQISYKGCATVGTYTAINCSGKCAIAVNAISYCAGVTFSVTADTAVMDDPRELKDLLSEVMNTYISIGKQIRL